MISAWKLQCVHSLSYNILVCPNSSTCKCSLQWVIDLVQGLWFLLHYQYWSLPWTPLRYPGEYAWPMGYGTIRRRGLIGGSLVLLEEICHCGGRVSYLCSSLAWVTQSSGYRRWQMIVCSSLPLSQSVEISAPPVSSLPVQCNASHHDDNGCTSETKPVPIEWLLLWELPWSQCLLVAIKPKLRHLLFPCVMEILQLSICRTGPLMCSSSSYMVGVRVDQFKTQNLGLGGSWIVNPTHSLHLNHQSQITCFALLGARASSSPTSDINMVWVGSQDQRYLHNLWWQHEPWTPIAAVPCTQTWPSAASQTRTLP
jgi:hypothetical protein